MMIKDYPTSQPALVDRLHAAHAHFAAICATLPVELREHGGSCGVWSPRQVVAHLAGWDREAARRIRVLITDPGDSKSYDVDGANARWVAERSALTWSETLTDWQEAFAALAGATMALTAAEFRSSPGIADWLAGRADDYRRHAAELMAWAQREGNRRG